MGAGSSSLTDIDYWEENKNIYREVMEKNVKCQICFLRARIPFKICDWWHVACEECALSTKCPSCGLNFSEGSPECLNEQHEFLSDTDCRYYQQGCRKNKFDSKDHEIFCEFRPAVCRLAKCPVLDEMPLNELMKHITEEHKDKVIVREHRFRWKKDPVLPVIGLGTLFWLKFPDLNDSNARTFQNRLRIKLEAMPMKTPVMKYAVTIQVEEAEKKYFTFSRSVKAYVRKLEEKEGIKAGIDGAQEWRYEDVDYPDQECLDIGGKDLDLFINGVFRIRLCEIKT